MPNTPSPILKFSPPDEAKTASMLLALHALAKRNPKHGITQNIASDLVINDKLTELFKSFPKPPSDIGVSLSPEQREWLGTLGITPTAADIELLVTYLTPEKTVDVLGIPDFEEKIAQELSEAHKSRFTHIHVDPSEFPNGSPAP